MKVSLTLSLLLAALHLPAYSFGAPPEDPEARKIYDHNYDWLKNAHVNFIGINMRGSSDTEYPERRQAAFDLLKEKHDLTVVPDLMDELKRGTFLSAQICELLGAWNTKKAVPLLKQVSADSKRPADVRTAAEKALFAIQSAKPDPGPPKY